MDRAIEVIRARLIERPDAGAIVPIECLAHRWRSRFLARLCHAIDPGAVLNDMGRGRIVDQRQAVTLVNGDRGLQEVGSSPVRGRTLGMELISRMAHAANNVESRLQRSNPTSSLCHFIRWSLPFSQRALLYLQDDARGGNR